MGLTERSMAGVMVGLHTKSMEMRESEKKIMLVGDKGKTNR